MVAGECGASRIGPASSARTTRTLECAHRHAQDRFFKVFCRFTSQADEACGRLGSESPG
jgi:hypothetical protein